MPRVLITGLNGFVAVHTAVIFLQNGWVVRGTVRSQEKAEKVKKLPCFAQAVQEGKVDVVILPDLVEGDYSAALKGVDAIAHCASPWHYSGKSWEEYRDPAVRGTTNVLEQAARVPTVRAVSIVSSIGAIADVATPFYEQVGRVYTEDDWLPVSEKQAEDASGPTATSTWYCASKKFAELAAWDTHKRLGEPYSLGTVCPPSIFGPAIHFSSATGEDLKNADVSTMRMYVSMGTPNGSEVPATHLPLYSDVRNVAQALYEIVVRPRTGRYPICNGTMDFQQIANRARELYPNLAERGLLTIGNPEDQPVLKGTYTLDGSKAVRELGINYIEKDDTIRAVIDQMIKLGAIKA